MKHGWAFLQSLTRAIEAWSAAMAKRDPDVFLDRGMDLRHAIERDVFFKIANDPPLQERFDARTEKQALPPASDNPWCTVIEPWLANDDTRPLEAKTPPLSALRRGRSRIGNLLRLGKPAFTTANLTSPLDILFLCIHPKFAEFFRPVTDAAGAGAAFLTINDVPLEKHLDGRGWARVGLRPVHFALPDSPLLSHFPHYRGILDSLCAMMETLKPRVIAVPEGNAPVYELALLAGQRHGVATVCVQHGAPAYTNPGFRNWHFDDVLVWGDAFIAPYARHNPAQHFTVAGTPALLPSPVDSGDAPIRSVGFFLQKAVTVIPAWEWTALLKFIGWTARTFPNLKIIVRDHPSQPHLAATERAELEGLPNLAFMPPPRFSLNDVLTACDVVVASASTTLLEAAQSGAIPFIFGGSYPEDFPDMVGAQVAVSAPDLAAAQTLMTRLTADGAWRGTLREAGRQFRPHLFAATGKEGAARIVALLRAIQPRP